MAMRRFKRRVAVLVLTLLAFAQGSVAFHACAMDRSAVGPLIASGSDEAGGDCDAPMSGGSAQNANLCLLHCTSDLQTAAAALALVGAPGNPPILAVVRAPAAPAPRTGLFAPPSGAPPHRILLHSFLI
jgi:hypothetical protein